MDERRLFGDRPGREQVASVPLLDRRQRLLQLHLAATKS